MSGGTVHEALQEEIAGLPEDLAAEALDFVRFVKARHADGTRAFAYVEEARIHRRSHPGEVMTVTIEEWEELIGGEG